VKWVADRSEGFIGDDHARDLVADAALALDETGRFLALRVSILANVGAYLSSDRGTTAQVFNLGSLAGVYATPAIYAEVSGVFTNTNVVAPYRGAGAPEACYVLERLIDEAANEIGGDRVELRRINLIPETPYATPLGDVYDCGRFERNLRAVVEAGEYAGFGARRDAASRSGKLRGIGICNAITQAAHPEVEGATVRFDKSGSATLLVGTNCQGQGHETMYRQILGSLLGLPPADIRVVDGDTDQVFYGRGTFGARSAALGGAAADLACQRIVEKGRKIAAHLLEAAEADIAFSDGRFTVVGTNRGVSLSDVAKVAHSPRQLPPEIEPGLDASAAYVPAASTYPTSCQLCEVEIDRETGRLEVIRYMVAYDAGTVINPLLADGQLHGAITQGIGQALMEQICFDLASGQLLTGSLMDYALPRADDLCEVRAESHAAPTKSNPLGSKGVAEIGIVGALPVAMLAVADALGSVGAEPVEMPATPQKIWRALRTADAGRASKELVSDAVP
jgi:carbon-monoxide dehydrogenase large subunit